MSFRAGARLFITSGLERTLFELFRNYMEKIFTCVASCLVAVELFSKNSGVSKNIFAGTEDGQCPQHTGHHSQLNQMSYVSLVYIATPVKVSFEKKKKVCCRKDKFENYCSAYQSVC